MAALLALLVGVPVAVWVYDKSMNRTGHNTKTSIIAGATVGFVAFILTLTIYLVLDSSIG